MAFYLNTPTVNIIMLTVLFSIRNTEIQSLLNYVQKPNVPIRMMIVMHTSGKLIK